MAVPTRMIQAKVEIPQMVLIRAGAKKVRIPVRLDLHNVSDFDYVLHSADARSEVFWHVVNENHEEVMKAWPNKGRGFAGMENFRSRTVAAGLTDHSTETLVLKASDLESGCTYTLQAEIFGQACQQDFVVVMSPPKAPAARKRTAKKAAARKKPAKKRAARKKS